MKTVDLSVAGVSWMEERTILLAPYGSRANGTETEESDYDFRGVCIPPIEYYLGLESFQGYDNFGGKNYKNTKDSVDVVIDHLSKFVKNAMSCAPNSIELMFTRPQDYIKVSELGQLLIDNRHLFLTKLVKGRFGGFAKGADKELLKGKAHLVEEFGYNTSAFCHGVRLRTSAIEILETYNFSTYRPNRELLIECKTGKYSYKEAVEMLAHYENQLQQAYEKSDIPEKVDTDKINKLLVEILSDALFSGVR
ncbi:putative nucleotidyltransferase [Bacillus phage vB_BceM_Bc431v3]|uniref:Putative nucleotidyltransferase n=1 Tax=Bacillus phage vB_BceM_Bc431v3 TaxID=1195072 RepID=M4HNQ4_9CAUD|nr:nucleotidyltransferase [Bacillus phage vB_BceM_Bc431v3]AFQ96486.1 putative nucleotidyltransferase [Bacillus phage vB_BceM_Bc431v3]